MKRWLFPLLLLPATLFAKLLPERAEEDKLWRAVEWNVENLFDTLHAQGFHDQEFLPDAERQWTGMRFRKKCNGIASTLIAMGGAQPVAVAALCEVENDSVMHHLCHHTKLARLGYRYAMTHGADRRGIDVALLYLPSLFRPVESTSLAVPVTEENPSYARDILLVSGIVPTGDTLDIIVCHLPSRSGNTPEHNRLRRHAANRIREAADSLIAARSRPQILIMGDFNDDYRSATLQKALRATLPANASGREDELVLLTHKMKAEQGIRGTYLYRGRWEQLDQIIVNAPLLRNNAPFRTTTDRCRIYADEKLLESNKQTREVKPRRTYLGTYYHGGLSDHLPLVLDFVY